MSKQKNENILYESGSAPPKAEKPPLATPGRNDNRKARPKANSSIPSKAEEAQKKSLFAKARPSSFLKKPSRKIVSVSEKSDSLKQAKEQLSQAREENLYLRAEFENFKKRSIQEKSDLVRYSGERFMASLANEVLDDLDRALTSARETDSLEDLKKGLEMIQQKRDRLFARFGLQVIDPTGQPFDPSYQEALSYIKTSKVPEGCVAETFKKAYKLYGKVIRPAQVVLAKKKEDG